MTKCLYCLILITFNCNIIVRLVMKCIPTHSLCIVGLSDCAGIDYDYRRNSLTCFQMQTFHILNFNISLSICSRLSLNFNRNLTLHFELSLCDSHPHLPFFCRSWHPETIERLRTLVNETIHLFHLTYKSSRSSLAILLKALMIWIIESKCR